MNAKKQSHRTHEQETTPQIPDTVSSNVGQDALHSHFILTTVVNLEKSIAQQGTTLKAVEKSLDGVKSKVDELASWKNKIIGGSIVLGVAASIVSVVCLKAFDYVLAKPVDDSIARSRAASVQPQPAAQKPMVKLNP